MGDDRPGIAGETTITLLDQFRVFYWSIRWWLWLMVGCFLIIFISMPSGGDADDSDDTFFNLSLIFIFLVLLWVGMIVIGYWRLGREQRNVRYRITAESVDVSDGTGARSVIPWTTIKRAREVRHAFLLRIRPIGLRWLPKRAFPEEGVAAFRALIAEKLDDRAKPRDFR
ncbi:MAG TPA: YcxB family protein [Stellaceae bacterium]|nr:YcxB family protein [Stellaceae bacterium]